MISVKFPLIIITSRTLLFEIRFMWGQAKFENNVFIMVLRLNHKEAFEIHKEMLLVLCRGFTEYVCVSEDLF